MPASSPPAPPEKVARHRLGRTHGEFVFAEEVADGMRLKRVADRRRRSMRIDVSNHIRRDFGITHSISHDAESAFVLGSRLRHVIGIGRRTVAHDLCHDRSSPPSGMVQLLENQDASAFADDEAIALLVPRTAGLFGIVVAG